LGRRGDPLPCHKVLPEIDDLTDTDVNTELEGHDTEDQHLSMAKERERGEREKRSSQVRNRVLRMEKDHVGGQV
jgi:hypothetical protein